MPAKQRGTAHRWQVTRRPTSGPKSTVAVVEKMAESPSSANARGVGILRAAILKKILTLTRRHVGVHPHVMRIPLAPRELRGGGHGAGATSTDCGLAAQVLAPPTEEVRQDHQPRGVPVDLLHLYPCDRGDEAIMANYFLVALTGMAR
jgi:hypothetical protein